MTYVTKAQLQERYGERRLIELTDTQPPFTQTIIDGVLDRAIRGIDGLIDAHLGARYALPLAAVPPLLEDAAASLVCAALYVDEAPNKVTADAAAALKTLKGLADGTLVLPGAALLEEAAANATVVVSGGAERLFGRAGLGGL